MKLFKTALFVLGVMMFALATPETINTLFSEPDQLRTLTRILMAVSYVGARVATFVAIWVWWIR